MIPHPLLTDMDYVLELGGFSGISEFLAHVVVAALRDM